MIYTSSWSNRFQIKPNRWVYTPTTESRDAGEKITELLVSLWSKPSFYFHLRNGGHVKAMSVHLQNRYFMVLDITDFFGHISRSRVTRALKPIVGYDKARKIAKASTIKAMIPYPHSHHIPYGFVQSPLLASICLNESKLGKLLVKINKNNTETVSVYVDDIIISSKNLASLSSVYNEILDATKKSKFLLNEDKTHNISTSIEAFNIKLEHRHMEITEKRFLKFKAEYISSDSEKVKEGIESYVRSVNNDQADLLQQSIIKLPVY